MPKRKSKSSRLTPKQKRFCEEYIIDLNGTQAYKRAGFPHKNDKVAAVQASKMLAKANISAFVASLVAKRSTATLVKADDVLREAMRIAFSDPRKLFNGNGDLRDVSTLDDAAAAAIASVEVTEEFRGKGEDREHVGYTKKVKLWDKNSALDKLFRYLKLYKDLGSPENPLSVKVIKDDIK